MIDTPPDTDLIPADVAEGEDIESLRREVDKEYVRIARDAYSASTTYFDAAVRRDVEQDIRHWQSQHLHGSKYLGQSYAGRSRLFVPKTRAAITKYEAQAAEAFFSSHDVVAVEANDKDDPEQVDAAKFYKALVQRRLTDPPPRGIPWFLTCIGAYQEAHATGIAIGKGYWDVKTDKPKIDLVPIENFRFDPACDWRDPASTSPYLVHILPMYVKDIRSRMASGRWRDVDEATLRKGIRRQSDTIRVQREGNRPDSQDQNHDFGDFNIVEVHEYIAEVGGRDMIWYMVQDHTMLSDPMPLEVQYAHGRPFAVGIVNIEANRQYPSSTSRLGRDLQREANDLRNQRIDNVSFVLNKRYFVKRNRQVDLDSLRRNMPASATLMEDPEGDVKVVDTPDVTSSAYQEQDRLNLDFDEVVGNFSQSSVQTNRNLNETVGGMNLLATNQNQVAAYKLRTFVETWVEPMLRMLVELERQYETDDRVIRLAAVGAGLDPAMVNDMIWSQEAQVTVAVGMSATNPQEKANMLLFGFNAIKTLLADGALEQRGLDAKEVAKEIFAMIGYRDGGRFFRWAEDDPVVAQMQQMIESLQQQLAAKHPPELLAAQVEKMRADTQQSIQRAVKEGVAAAYSAMQAGQVIASVPSVAPIADEVMRTAGWQPAAGADPDFPQPAGPDPALMQGEVGDRRTGVSFMPGGQVAPESPETGAIGMGDGIETAQGDGIDPTRVGA
ncbi:MAG: hypothetical protein WC322_03820 [Candidatus Paceibacterota bacterium]|jgi:hypothetical protein